MPPAVKVEETKVAAADPATPAEPSVKIPAAHTPEQAPAVNAAPPAPVSETNLVAAPQPAQTSDGVADGPIADATENTENPIAETPKQEPSKTKNAKKPIEKPAEKIAPASGRYQAMLTVLESELRSTSQKPFDQQDLLTLSKRYEEIADQSDESVPAQIAKIRVRQLRDRDSLRDSRKGLRTDEVELANYRANMDSERMKIARRRTEAAMVKFDLEGELRKSAVFTTDNRRFRLVDRVRNETIAYVDVPRSVEPNVDQMIGRLVGIHAAGQTFSPSARLPIVVAASVTDLTPRAHMGDDGTAGEPAKTGSQNPATEKPADKAVSNDKKKLEPKKTASAGGGDTMEPNN
jgi:hypothetical protein